MVLPHVTYTNLYLVVLNLLHVNRPFSLNKRAFAELVMCVESALEDGIHVFKLAELHAAYKNRLKNLIIFLLIGLSKGQTILLFSRQWNFKAIQLEKWNVNKIFPSLILKLYSWVLAKNLPGIFQVVRS